MRRSGNIAVLGLRNAALLPQQCDRDSRHAPRVDELVLASLAANSGSIRRQPSITERLR